MRIALHVDGTAIRGNEKQALVIARELKRRGHQVGVSVVAGSEVEAELGRMGIETTRARPRGDAEVFGALAFARWLRKGRYDALLLTSWKRSFATGWAGRVAGVPRIVYRVGGVHRIPGGPSGWKHRRTLLRYADCIVANSGAVADHLLRSVPDLPPERIRVVLNGVSRHPERAGGVRVSGAGLDASAMDTRPVAASRTIHVGAAPLRSELALLDGDVLAVAVGGLERRKGYDVLLEAFAAMGDAAPRLAIAGEGAEAAALAELARARGIDGRVSFLGQRGDVPAVLAAADLFVLASRSEGFAVALLEAMAAGIPAISTDVGGAREALAPREGRPAAGWIVPADDPPALAAAIREVMAEIGPRADEGGEVLDVASQDRQPHLSGSEGQSPPSSADVDAAREDRARPQPSLHARLAEAAWRMEHWFTVDAMMDGIEAALRGDPPGRVVANPEARAISAREEA